MPDDDLWVLYMHKGRLLKRRPWCDCEKRKGFGYRKRDDGAWVRPCCMRRERAAFERLGDGPMEHDPLKCQWCIEAVAGDRADPVLTQNSEGKGVK